MRNRGWLTIFRTAFIVGAAVLALAACSEAPVENAGTSGQANNGQVNGEQANRVYAEGTYYRVLEHPVQQEQQEPYLVEYLWVGCPACQRFEPIMQGFKEANPNVPIVRRHGVFNQRWALDARMFHAANIVAERDVAVEMLAFYQAQSPELPDFSDLSTFLRQQGLDEQAVFDLADSNEVEAIMEQTLSEMRANNIPGVPAVVVNGRYLVKNPLPDDINTQQDYNQLIEYLLSLD